ncbi:MAG: acylphosphatase [candidate division WOR-3 bacterium]
MKEECDDVTGETTRAHLYVSGIVQGVFFRAHTTKVARSLGLNGWVKNLVDGRVEIVAEGTRQDVDKLIQWCQKGPPAAAVEGVEVLDEQPMGDVTQFQIRY